MIDSKLKLYRERVFDVLHKTRAQLLPVSARETYETRIRRDAFGTIAKEGRWGGAFESGWGSTVENTGVTRQVIVMALRDFSIRSMLDAACGDFSWMPLVLQQLPSDFRYIGCDIVPELISRNRDRYPQHEFRVLDFVADELPPCDLILCRDALQHLPVSDIKKALENFSRSEAKYLLCSIQLRRFGWRNGRDMRVGRCRDRNLLLHPFNLADPIVIYSEQDAAHKFLGLWRIPLTHTAGR